MEKKMKKHSFERIGSNGKRFENFLDTLSSILFSGKSEKGTH
jgi:hypothetical protein